MSTGRPSSGTQMGAKHGGKSTGPCSILKSATPQQAFVADPTKRLNVNFVIDNWYLVLVALVSGSLLLWPMIAGAATAGALTANGAVQLINREKAVVIDVSWKKSSPVPSRTRRCRWCWSARPALAPGARLPWPRSSVTRRRRRSAAGSRPGKTPICHWKRPDRLHMSRCSR